LFEEKVPDLVKKYKNGNKCGQVRDPLIAQTYITNPLLLDKGNKFIIRTRMLIASTNPMLVFYNDGFIRASPTKYEKSSRDVKTCLFF